MKIIIIIAAIIGFIWGFGEANSIVGGVIGAVIGLIAALMLRATLRKMSTGTWQCHNCAMTLYNTPKPSPNGCTVGGKHSWFKVSGN
jgi:lysylphosphatidylglycerol synthetase-like protein (DUF2156 family)